jgi:glycosyltransferase involved in cell wall biosynthesis
VEGFGLAALEAMASGTPVMAASGSSLAEVVGQAGVLVDPYDEEAMTQALHALLGDEDRRRSLSMAGRSQAARFTWQKAARQTWQLYEDLEQ